MAETLKNPRQVQPGNFRASIRQMSIQRNMDGPNYGTNSTLDTLAASQQTIAKYGEDKAFEALDRALEIHNAEMESMIGEFVEVTDDRQRRYGNPTSGAMVEVDEHGVADAQKVAAGQTIGFPLRLYAYSVQWTKKYMETATGEEMAAQFTAALDADAQNMIMLIKRALYSPFNYLSADRLVDHLNIIRLPIKALVNADGMPLPIGPYGRVFDGATHNHYLTCETPGTLTTDDAKGLIQTVVEHYNSGTPIVIISFQDEEAWASLDGFVRYHDVRITQPTTAEAANLTPLDVVDIFNRRIGVFGGAEVWVKPWAEPGFAFCWVPQQPKPIAQRVRNRANNKYVLAAQDEDHPLRAQQYERETGFSIWNRTNGALLDYAHSVYTAPNITSPLGG